MSAASATLRAIGPPTASGNHAFTLGQFGTRPGDGRRPTTLQKLAGLRDAHPAIVKGVRGQGLMIGLETHVTPADFVGAARAQQLLSVPAGDNVTRLLPPLVVSDAELSESVARLERACVALEKTRGASS